VCLHLHRVAYLVCSDLLMPAIHSISSLPACQALCAIAAPPWLPWPAASLLWCCSCSATTLRWSARSLWSRLCPCHRRGRRRRGVAGEPGDCRAQLGLGRFDLGPVRMGREGSEGGEGSTRCGWAKLGRAKEERAAGLWCKFLFFFF
jgi:hypothetical protein